MLNGDLNLFEGGNHACRRSGRRAGPGNCSGFEAETETPEQTDEPGGEEASESVPATEEAAAEPSELDGIKAELEAQKQKVFQLNQALHKTRKEKAAPKEEAEALTKEQLKTLMKEHADDPETLYNITEYIASQAAKKHSTEAIDAQRLSQLKTETEKVIYERFPQLNDDSSQDVQVVNATKERLHIGDHPASTYLAASVIVAEAMPKQLEDAYNRGRADGLKGLADKNRKKNVKETALTPPKKPASQKPSGLTGTMKQTAKQMGLTDAQAKLYASFVNKKES